MPSKKALVIPVIINQQDLDDMYTFKVVSLPPKDSIRDWSAVLLKNGKPAAEFKKGYNQKTYTIHVNKEFVAPNLNGVKAAYQDWVNRITKEFELQTPIVWEPQDRTFYRYQIGGGGA